MKYRATALLLTLVFCCLLGCGSELELVPVGGTVMVEGKPYENAKVLAYPTDGPAGFGKTNAQGEFDLNTRGQSGVKVGSYTFTVTPDAREPVPVPNKPIVILQVPYDQKLRDRRQSTLHYEVVAGENNNITIDLTAGTVTAE